MSDRSAAAPARRAARRQSAAYPIDAGARTCPQWGTSPWRGGRQGQHAYSPPPISRARLSRIVTSRSLIAWNSDWSCRTFVPERQRRSEASAPSRCTATEGSSVTIVWPPSRDTRVVGYGVHVNGAQVGTQTPDQVKRWRDRDVLSFTIRELACGTGYTVGVDAFDRGDDHSPMTSTTVSTSACPDATAALVAHRRSVRSPRRRRSVMLAWSPSSDNVGVVEYGLYASGLRVQTLNEANATLTNLACGTSYLIAIDAADAAGNRSAAPARIFRTSACPSSNQPPSTPTRLKGTAVTPSSVCARLDGRQGRRRGRGYGLYLAGKRTTETTRTSAEFTGLQCGTDLRARRRRIDAAGKRSAVAELVHRDLPVRLHTARRRRQRRPATAVDPDDRQRRRRSRASSTGARSTTKTATRSRTTPARSQFLRRRHAQCSPRSTIALRRQLRLLAPSPSTTANTASRCAHSATAGTLLATNTVTATVGNNTPPPPPPSSTGAVTQTIVNGATLSTSSTGAPSTTKTATRSRTTPARSQFLVDGKQVLSEINPPFGDTSPTWLHHRQQRPTHFQVRALNDSRHPARHQHHHRHRHQHTRHPRRTPPLRRTPGKPQGHIGHRPPVSPSPGPATDNVAVTGYDLYRAGSKVGSTPQTIATFNGLTCGSGYSVGVERSTRPATRRHKRPFGHDVRLRRHAAAHRPDQRHRLHPHHHQHRLTWAPATDNIGVAGYGSTMAACSSTPPPAPPASSAASPAVPTTPSRSTPSTPQATTPPRPPSWSPPSPAPTPPRRPRRDVSCERLDGHRHHQQRPPTPRTTSV